MKDTNIIEDIMNVKSEVTDQQDDSKPQASSKKSDIVQSADITIDPALEEGFLNSNVKLEDSTNQTKVNDSANTNVKTEILSYIYSLIQSEVNTAEKKTHQSEPADKNGEMGKALKRKSKESKKVKIKKAKVQSKEEPAGGNEEQNKSPPQNDDIEYCLTVTNLPNSWSFMDIKNYIDTQCGPVDEIEMVKADKTGNGAIRLLYQSEEECKAAMSKLADKDIEGTKLTVSSSVIDLSKHEIQSNSQTETSTATSSAELKETQPNSTTISKPWRPDLDVWDIDPKGTYGLKKSFLKSLGITPPLDKWVHVSNFRCDKTDLRDVMEMAGTVVTCSVFINAPKYANVMYQHPLEAVQAVSMLNGQILYGQALKVVMQQSPANAVLLAKGLANVGQGLGAGGKPLRSILTHYHRYVTNQSASINRIAFENPTTPNNNLLDAEEFEIKKAEEFNAPPKDAENKTTDAQNTTNIDKKSDDSPIPKSPEVVNKVVAKPVKSKPKISVVKVQSLQSPTPTPVRSPVRQPAPQSFQPRNGPGYGQFGPQPGPAWMGHGPDPRMQRPFGPGPGPRPMWNGPGPSRPMGPMGLPGPMQGPRPMGPMPGPRTMGPMPGPRPMGPMPGPMQGPMPGPMQRPMEPMGLNQGLMGQGFPNQPVQLQLSNLPPSTTYPLLCEKMAACGHVVSIQLTTPGSAVVTFANKMQADSCFQTYNNFCIEGCVIKVKYS